MGIRTSSKDHIDMDDLKKTMEQAIETTSQATPRTEEEFVKYLSEAVYLGFSDILLRHGDGMKRNLSKVENEPQKNIDKTTKNLSKKVADFWKADDSLDAFIKSNEDTKVEKLNKIITLLTSIDSKLDKPKNTIEPPAYPADGKNVKMFFLKYAWYQIRCLHRYLKPFYHIIEVCFVAIMLILFLFVLNDNSRMRRQEEIIQRHYQMLYERTLRQR